MKPNREQTRMDASAARVIESLARRFEEDGLPRIAGRILGCLLFSAEARSLDELVELLGVSKASISMNARLLERASVILRDTRPGDRRDFYRVAEDLHERMLAHWLRGLRDVGVLLGAALREDASMEPAVRRRVETFAAFFDHMLEEIQGSGERWAGHGAAGQAEHRRRATGS